MWGVLAVVMLWQMPRVAPLVFWMSLIFPLYYFGLSLVLHRRRQDAR
jgi:hypothetical protein